MVRCVGGAGGEVGEERLVGHQRLLLTDPVDRVVGHVLGEVVALLRGAVGLDRHGAVVDGRGVLVRLAADEAVEVLEATAARGPGVERAHRARLPHRHLVALAELRGRVAVQLQRLGERRRRVRADRAVARRRGRDLRDPAHADRVVVATGEKSLAGRRAQGRRVEAVVLQPVVGEPLGGRRRAGPAERARGAEAAVVDEDDEDVRSALGRAQRLDRGKLGVRILGVVGDQPRAGPVWDRKAVARELVGHAPDRRWAPAQGQGCVLVGRGRPASARAAGNALQSRRAHSGRQFAEHPARVSARPLGAVAIALTLSSGRRGGKGAEHHRSARRGSGPSPPCRRART